MNQSIWIWQQPGWPHFSWQAEPLAPLLRACTRAQGRLLGMLDGLGKDAETHISLNALLENIMCSSAIEGEQVDEEALRSTLKRHLGQSGTGDTTPRLCHEGLAQLLLDAINKHTQTLDLQRLCSWHEWLFQHGSDLLNDPLRVGMLRGDDPMQVVSGSASHLTVHYEAPPRANLEKELADFLTWFEDSRHNSSLDPLLRAGITHFWFVTLHPFEDGNGRITRILTDLALAQSDRQAIRFYAMSASIFDDRKNYYQILEASQKSNLDITNWLEWFFHTLLVSLEQALTQIDQALAKTRFWQAHQMDSLPLEQAIVLNRLLDGVESDFGDSISAAQYQSAAQVSKATATRHLSDLLEKGYLRRMPGGGRSTRYQINQPSGTSLATQE
ncbi:Fic family protein [Pseudomonas alvandae]|uniref:Fic family protein n=1 Tax=Pseudomonas canavaninivorans TaxID=2842348 RepID=UPI00215F3017|nr:Fic family protein [Pseudomonas canavaninivorans]UVM72068.1 Fic family protein [Pseudomonas canavaninivorans]